MRAIVRVWIFAGLVLFANPALAQFGSGRSPMSFTVQELRDPACGGSCPKVVVADGVIEENTPEAFIEFARRAALSDGLRSVVFIDSPGGNVVASMELGAVFRKLRLSAIVAGFASENGLTGPVAGECVSACVYALMGAVRRVAPSVSRVALHRMSIEAEQGAPRHFADTRLVAIVAQYAKRMGVSPALVWAAESLQPDHVRVLTQREIGGWRLASSRF